jgi:hypothetical protein
VGDSGLERLRYLPEVTQEASSRADSTLGVSGLTAGPSLHICSQLTQNKRSDEPNLTMLPALATVILPLLKEPPDVSFYSFILV